MSTPNRIVYLALTFSIALLSSCYNYVESELPYNCDNPTEVSYSQHIQPIINSNCALSGCHNSGSPNGDLTVFDNVELIATNGQMKQVVAIEESMPPTGPLHYCDQQLICDWIDQGAQNN